MDAAWKAGATDPSCTSSTCAWNQPTGSQKDLLEYRRIRDMTWDKPLYNSKGNSVHSASIRGRSLYKPNITITDQAHLVTACLSFAPSSVLSRVWPTQFSGKESTERVTNNVATQLPPTVLDLCDDVNTVAELLSKLKPIAPETVGWIERETVGQNDNPCWHRQRLGRITASHFHDVYTKVESVKRLGYEHVDCTPLLSILLGHKTVPSSLPALKHGRDMEPKAKIKFVSLLSMLGHKNVRLQECGLYILSARPYLAASPDAIVECDCCGSFIVEIKSPMTDTGMPDYLVKENANYQLKTSHRHYTQIHGQMAATNIYRAYLFVFMSESVLVRVDFDSVRWNAIVANLEQFFVEFMAASLLKNKTGHAN